MKGLSRRDAVLWVTQTTLLGYSSLRPLKEKYWELAKEEWIPFPLLLQFQSSHALAINKIIDHYFYTIQQFTTLYMYRQAQSLINLQETEMMRTKLCTWYIQENAAENACRRNLNGHVYNACMCSTPSAATNWASLESVPTCRKFVAILQLFFSQSS